MQTFYIAVCVTELFFYDRSDWVKQKIPKVRHWMYGSLALPIAYFVSRKKKISYRIYFDTLFFSVTFFTTVKAFGSSTFDLVRALYAHGGIAVFITIDAIICKHKYANFGEQDQRRSRIQLFKQSFAPVAAILCYLCWNLISYQFNHVYPYAIQNVLKDSVGYTALLYSSEVVLMWIIFWIGYFLNKCIHRKKSLQQAEEETTFAAEDSEALLGGQHSNPV
jgi:hypothetical protein